MATGQTPRPLARQTFSFVFFFGTFGALSSTSKREPDTLDLSLSLSLSLFLSPLLAFRFPEPTSTRISSFFLSFFLSFLRSAAAAAFDVPGPPPVDRRVKNFNKKKEKEEEPMGTFERTEISLKKNPKMTKKNSQWFHHIGSQSVPVRSDS